MAYVDHTFSITEDEPTGTAYIVENRRPIKEILLAAACLGLGLIAVISGLIMMHNRVGGDKAHGIAFTILGGILFMPGIYQLRNAYYAHRGYKGFTFASSVCTIMAGTSFMLALSLSMVGGASTALGALLVILYPAPNLKRLGLLQGLAAGLMLTLSFLDLMFNAINAIGFTRANFWFFGGALMFAAIVTFVPEPSIGSVAKTSKAQDHSEKDLAKKQRKQVLFSGIITAIGISLHNFPEGMAVFLGSMKGIRVGVSLALAIALHNIPEGIAVALPVYFATESKWQSFKIAAASGFAEPLGVIIVAFFFPSGLSMEVVEGLLAGVGGVMAFLTLHEMLPLAYEYGGHRQAVTAVFVGMAVMSLSLQILEISLPQ